MIKDVTAALFSLSRPSGWVMVGIYPWTLVQKTIFGLKPVEGFDSNNPYPEGQGNKFRINVYLPTLK